MAAKTKHEFRVQVLLERAYGQHGSHINFRNREDTNRFIMMLEGWISREEFFNPENLQRIICQS